MKLKNQDRELKVIRTQIKKGTEINFKNQNKKLLEELVKETPIDTGYARSRWQLELGKDKASITNDAPYIEHLNAGSSKQAPEFFIEQTALKYGKPIGAIVTVTPD